MCQHVEDLHNSVKQYFPKDQCIMLQNCAWIKDPFRAQDRAMDFILIEDEKFIEMPSDSTLQLNFKEFPLVKFGCSIKEEYAQSFEKGIKIPLPFPTTHLYEARFFSTASTKKHSITKC